MDYFILINTCISTMVFLIVHILAFRSISHERVVKWIPLVFLFGLSTPMIIVISTGLMFPRIMMFHSFVNIIFVLAASVILYTLIVFIYILGVFGIMVASIRIRILTDIAKKEKNGINKKNILQKYRQQIIINNRLKRLVGSNVLVYGKGFYKIRNKKSLFIIHALIMRSLRQIYTGKEGRN